MSFKRSNLDTKTFIDGQCEELWYLVFDVNFWGRKGRNQTTQNGIRCFLPSEIDKNLSIRSLWQGKVMVIFRFWWNIVEIIFYRLQDSCFGPKHHFKRFRWNFQNQTLPSSYLILSRRICPEICKQNVTIRFFDCKPTFGHLLTETDSG